MKDKIFMKSLKRKTVDDTSTAPKLEDILVDLKPQTIRRTVAGSASKDLDECYDIVEKAV